MENNIGIPKIPKHIKSIKKVEPPDLKIKKVNTISDYEHSWQLILHIFARGIRNLPKLVITIVLPLIIVTVINIILESIPTYSLYGIKRTIVLLLVFLTSSYNSAVPRAIYWVLIFTIGKNLFRRVRKEGFSKVLKDFKQFPVFFKAAKRNLNSVSNYLLITGAGLGFFAANFLSRNNRIDKVLVCFVLAIALVNALSKGKKGLLFITIKLLYKDLTVFNKKFDEMTDDHSYFILSGVVLGLVGNTIFAIIKLSYGGYILGSALAIIGLVMFFSNKKEVKVDEYQNG